MIFLFSLNLYKVGQFKDLKYLHGREGNTRAAKISVNCYKRNIWYIDSISH